MQLYMFNDYQKQLMLAQHDWDSHTFKLLLTATAPVATNSLVSDITQISAGNGYTAGGLTLTVASVTQASGTAAAFINDLTLTASGGAIADWRYYVIANSTQSMLVCWGDAGSTITVSPGTNYIIPFNQVSGAITTAKVQ